MISGPHYPMASIVLVMAASKFLPWGIFALRATFDGGAWDVIVSIETSNFLGNICLVGQVRTIGRDENDVVFKAGAELFQNGFHFLSGQIDVKKFIDPLGRFQRELPAVVDGFIVADDIVQYVAGIQQFH